MPPSRLPTEANSCTDRKSSTHQQTCEQCHWPQKFYGAAERVMTHEHHQQRPNTSPATNSIKVIPWVRVTDANGKITVYKSRENPLSANNLLPHTRAS